MTPAGAMPRRRWLLPLRLVRSRPWLFGCALIGVVIGLLAPSGWHWATRCLVGWNVAILVYFSFAGTMMARADERAMRQRARLLDEGQFAILSVSILAALFSIAAIVVELGSDKDMAGAAKGWHVGLAIATIVLSWFFIHLTFTLHYANEYYREYDADGDGTPDLRGGLHFPNTHAPRYIDFLYYAFTIGVAAQTADVETCSRDMRLITLAQSIVAFFFNTAILALAINIAAGLL